MLEYVIDNLVEMDIREHPNILLHGCEGVPHTRVVETFIARRFGLTLPLVKRYPIWNGLPYVETDYYIEIDCFHPDFTNVLLELLLTICRHKCIHLERHIIFLRNIDYFHRKNPQCLRVLFERFSQNALFICSTYHLNRVEKPLQSRMQLYRIPFQGEVVGRKKEPAIVLELENKEAIRRCALKLFQQDIRIKDVVTAALPKVPEALKGDFVARACAIDHASIYCDEVKYAFHLELLLHALKGFVT